MDARSTIKAIVAQSPAWSLNRLGAHMGLSSSAMGNRMSPTRSDMRVGFVVAALDALGYDLVAVPKGSRLPNGSIVIDGARGGGQS